MPSTNKTTNLKLNKWSGSDKPKKDDFNADNQLIDTAYGQTSQTIGALQTTVADNKQTLQQSIGQVDGRCTTINGSLSTHIANAVAHITAAERTAWNSMDKAVIGTYSGTGANSLNVNMGFKPRFGLLFGVGVGIVECQWGLEETSVYAGFFTSSGCSKNIALTSTGITVTHNATTPASGCAFRYNQNGTTYVWLAWK